MNNTDRHIDKTIVITGATSGIGLATAMELAGRGARIIGTGRSQPRCNQAEDAIRAAHPGARISYIVADLSSLRQVRELASAVKEKVSLEGGGALDVLINNAGTVSSWYVSTVDGFELQFAVNHLAPFLLTRELLPLLKASPEGRVITVSSGSHYKMRMHWKDVLMRKHYNCLMAYKQSKLANVIFSTELNRRLGPEATVRAYAVDPGLVNTDIGLKGTTGIARWVWERRSRGGIRPEKAAASIAYLAAGRISAPEEVYWKECSPQQPSKYSQDKKEALRLWELSERMCGVAVQAARPDSPAGDRKVM